MGCAISAALSAHPQGALIDAEGTAPEEGGCTLLVKVGPAGRGAAPGPPAGGRAYRLRLAVELADVQSCLRPPARQCAWEEGLPAAVAALQVREPVTEERGACPPQARTKLCPARSWVLGAGKMAWPRGGVGGPDHPSPSPGQVLLHQHPVHDGGPHQVVDGVAGQHLQEESQVRHGPGADAQPARTHRGPGRGTGVAGSAFKSSLIGCVCFRSNEPRFSCPLKPNLTEERAPVTESKARGYFVAFLSYLPVPATIMTRSHTQPAGCAAQPQGAGQPLRQTACALAQCLTLLAQLLTDGLRGKCPRTRQKLS